ncbi:hypothetical protein PQU92_08705 [Asticcacaulis sp. BYS171W]|uniref:ATP-grasp domain-containing protein n=1 Tax=Asticcacaulis aquaticus TaxID=2984212 RepID=A0ABT5HTJ1_9CAUL|nr:hypothetical protein [Asticcacaulis aquaticus]MDC7683354.1 hypothetical protein [Asticcacaulis aquaticus]
MKKSLLILTPNPAHPSHHGRWPAVLDAYRTAFAGFEVHAQPWSAPLTQAYDLVLPLVAWGYHNAPEDFRRALAALKAKGFRMLNPPEIVSWNVDKRYLRDLAEAGIRIVPTLFSDGLTRSEIEAARADFGQKAVVLKPVISAGAKNTLIFDGDVLPDNAPPAEAMIQPFMPAIQSEGEWSLIFFDGTFSHAVLKTPKPGDFRSQPDYDAHLRVETPPVAAVELAYEALEFVGQTLLYARVDMVRDAQGRFCLMELELIEPDLYLKYENAAPARLRHAVEHALGTCGHHH